MLFLILWWGLRIQKCVRSDRRDRTVLVAGVRHTVRLHTFVYSRGKPSIQSSISLLNKLIEFSLSKKKTVNRAQYTARSHTGNSSWNCSQQLYITITVTVIQWSIVTYPRYTNCDLVLSVCS